MLNSSGKYFGMKINNATQSPTTTKKYRKSSFFKILKLKLTFTRTANTDAKSISITAKPIFKVGTSIILEIKKEPTCKTTTVTTTSSNNFFGSKFPVLIFSL